MAITVSAGQRVTAQDFNNLVPLSAFKTVDQSVVSSTTMVQDNDLIITVPGGVWQVEFHLFVDGAAAGDVRTELIRTGSSTAVGNRAVRGMTETGTDVANTAMRTSGGHGFTTDIITGTQSVGTQAYLTESCVISWNGIGSIYLQWAQGTSNVTATTMKAGSYVIARRLS